MYRVRLHRSPVVLLTVRSCNDNQASLQSDGQRVCKQNPACVNLLAIIVLSEYSIKRGRPHCISWRRRRSSAGPLCDCILSSSSCAVEYSALKVITSLHHYSTARPGHVTLLERVFVYIGPAAAPDDGDAHTRCQRSKRRPIVSSRTVWRILLVVRRMKLFYSRSWWLWWRRRRWETAYLSWPLIVSFSLGWNPSSLNCHVHSLF